jgi:hypothetical protein
LVSVESCLSPLLSAAGDGAGSGTLLGAEAPGDWSTFAAAGAAGPTASSPRAATNAQPRSAQTISGDVRIPLLSFGSVPAGNSIRVGSVGDELGDVLTQAANSHAAKHFSPAARRLFWSANQTFKSELRFLDSPESHQYGPRGFEGGGTTRVLTRRASRKHG